MSVPTEALEGAHYDGSGAAAAGGEVKTNYPNRVRLVCHNPVHAVDKEGCAACGALLLLRGRVYCPPQAEVTCQRCQRVLRREAREAAHAAMLRVARATLRETSWEGGGRATD